MEAAGPSRQRPMLDKKRKRLMHRSENIGAINKAKEGRSALSGASDDHSRGQGRQKQRRITTQLKGQYQSKSVNNYSRPAIGIEEKNVVRKQEKKHAGLWESTRVSPLWLWVLHSFFLSPFLLFIFPQGGGGEEASAQSRVRLRRKN